MLKREFKVNFKSFLIWLLILIGIFLLVYLVYPFIITDESVKSMDELMKVFPEEVLKAFNMDMSSISTAYGWLKSEGFMFVLLITGFYSSMLGGTILLKEENDKTIEYLYSLPIKRKRILTNKLVVSLIYIILIVLILGIFNYIALLISCDFDQKQYLLLSVTPLFICLPFFGINLLLSTFLHKTKMTVGISLGMVFLSYLLNMMSQISKNVEFLQYFSIHTLADVRNVLLNVEIQPLLVLISLGITIITVGLSYVIYQKKELII